MFKLRKQKKTRKPRLKAKKSLFGDKKRSAFSDKTRKKADQKKYKKPVSYLNRNTIRQKFKKIKSKRNSNTRKLAKLFAYNTETKLPNIVNIYTIAATLIFLILSILYFLFFTNHFQLKTIQIYEGQALSSNKEIRKLIDPLHNKNLLLIPKDKVSILLHNEIENMNQVKIQKKYPNTLIIEYQKFSEVANLINKNQTNDNIQKFIINEIGIITESERNDPSLKIINTQSDKNYQLGDQILKKEQISYILEATSFFQEKLNLEITETKFLPVARELHLKTERGFYIWLDITQKYEDQIQKLKNAIPKIDIYSDNFQYIDLRIESAKGDKIIYKRA